MTDKNTLKHRVRSAAEDFGEAARLQAQSAFESVVEVAEDGADRAHRVLKRQMRDRPVTLTAAALGIGVLVGLALRNGNGRHASH